MMKKILLTGSIFLMMISSFAQQSDSTLSFTLDEAQQYALQNSPVIKNAQLDLESAKKKVWETTAIGLPQANVKYSNSYSVELNDQIVSMAQAFSIDPVTGQPTVKEDDLRKSSSFDFTVSQLIFSGAYIVGLQTSKVFKSLSEIGITKSTNDLKESVSNAYFAVLVMKESKQITDSSYQNLLKLFNDMQSMQKQGFIDETDIDQLSISVSNLKSTADMLTRQAEIMENLFKYQIGLDLKAKIVLKDSIGGHLSKLDKTNLLKNFEVETLPDYQLLDAQAKLMNLNLKLQKSAFLPDLAAFYQYHKNLNDKSFEFTPPQIVGLSVSVPIFSSGQRLARVSQAKMGYQKAVNTRDQVAKGLIIDFESTKSNYISANEKFQTDKKNLDISKRIYSRSIIKYKNGMISSSELMQVQNQYFSTQGTYYTSLLSLINAENKLNKLLGN